MSSRSVAHDSDLQCRLASVEERDVCLRIRHDVFVREQGVSAELERDELDSSALHFIAYRDGEAVGTARAVVDATTASVKVGRVAVIRKARGTGAGRALMHAILAAPELRDVRSIHLSAQVPAVDFYRRLGFTVIGEVYEEAGIPHLAMCLTRS